MLVEPPNLRRIHPERAADRHRVGGNSRSDRPAQPALRIGAGNARFRPKTAFEPGQAPKSFRNRVEIDPGLSVAFRCATFHRAVELAVPPLFVLGHGRSIRPATNVKFFTTKSKSNPGRYTEGIVTVVFATCDHQPLLTADDQVLADALARLGITVTPQPWTEIDPYAVIEAPAIVLRSTWDYHRVPTMFRAWLESLLDSGRPMWNEPSIALENIDKIYLHNLEAQGISIPKTVWLDNPSVESIRDAMSDERWAKAVLKPRIAATAHGTFLVTPETHLTDDELTPARASGALLQEFIPEIEDRGETSLVYCDGVFSHAVVKRSKAGDFRVQKDFGGSVELVTPSQELLTFGDRVLQTLRHPCLYARVDIVVSARGPLLMELELIEPELYFLFEPIAADRFASAIVQRLTGDLRPA